MGKSSDIHKKSPIMSLFHSSFPMIVADLGKWEPLTDSIYIDFNSIQNFGKSISIPKRDFEELESFTIFHEVSHRVVKESVALREAHNLNVHNYSYIAAFEPSKIDAKQFKMNVLLKEIAIKRIYDQCTPIIEALSMLLFEYHLHFYMDYDINIYRKIKSRIFELDQKIKEVYDSLVWILNNTGRAIMPIVVAMASLDYPTSFTSEISRQYYDRLLDFRLQIPAELSPLERFGSLYAALDAINGKYPLKKSSIINDVQEDSLFNKKKSLSTMILTQKSGTAILAFLGYITRIAGIKAANSQDVKVVLNRIFDATVRDLTTWEEIRLSEDWRKKSLEKTKEGN